eukprot:Gb_15461 [translate_table: standard]
MDLEQMDFSNDPLERFSIWASPCARDSLGLLNDGVLFASQGGSDSVAEGTLVVDLRVDKDMYAGMGSGCVTVLMEARLPVNSQEIKKKKALDLEELSGGGVGIFSVHPWVEDSSKGKAPLDASVSTGFLLLWGVIVRFMRPKEIVRDAGTAKDYIPLEVSHPAPVIKGHVSCSRKIGSPSHSSSEGKKGMGGLVKSPIGSVIILGGKESEGKSGQCVVVCDNYGKEGYVGSSENG